MMVLYTAAVRHAIEHPPINGNVQQAMRAFVEDTEMAMCRSSTPSEPAIAEVNFVHAEEVPRTEGTDFHDDLDWLRLDTGALALRDQWGADVVMLVKDSVPAGYPNCGLSNEPEPHSTPPTPPGPDFAPRAFGVILYDCPFSRYNFEHELGHVLGANHNPENNTNPDPLEPWAFGHWKAHPPGKGQDGHRTIMSIAFTDQDGLCVDRVQILNYSNADIFYPYPDDLDPEDPGGGFCTGVAGERENARTIADYSSFAVDYRPHVDRIFTNGFER
ncbi:MAG TPA: hypothetical protein VFG55_06350 [Rhodanobacteraceae bacterium]|nr:hypothetical protein [Rhodanobacteraceae bacterium]